MAESSPNRLKTLWKKEKVLVTSNFYFSNSVFKSLELQTRKNQGLFGKGLIYLDDDGPIDSQFVLQNTESHHQMITGQAEFSKKVETIDLDQHEQTMQADPVYLVYMS